MSNTQTGRVHLIGAKQQVTDKFAKQEIVIATEGEHPQYISFQNNNDKVDLSALRVGDNITVHYNLNGRKWTSPQGEYKYFNTLVVWKVDGISQASAPAPQHETGADESQLPF